MSVFIPTREQKSVITAGVDQRTLVIAGPGTGKTETVARRLASILSEDNIRPSQILVLCFSKSAVKALVARLRSLELTNLAALEELRYLSVRTFDSWTFRTLRFLGEDPADLLKNDFDDNIDLLVSKLDGLGAEGSLKAGHPQLGSIRHLVVDEFQDLAGIRAELVQKLLTILTSPDRPSEPCGFTILGDPNQAIYDFSLANSDYDGDCGSSRELTRWIGERFGEDLVTVRLSKNHRSAKGIAGLVEEAAGMLFDAGEDDELNAVELMEDFLEDRLDVTDPDELFDYIASGSDEGMAVLCRSNSQTIEILMQMQYLSYTKRKPVRGLYMNAGTPPDRLPAWVGKLLHQFKGGALTRNNFLKIFKLIFPKGCEGSPCDGDAEAAWNLLLGYAKSGEGETSLDMTDLRKRIRWPDALPDDEGLADASVTLTTIHQSKGLEYRKVRIVKANETGDGFDSPDEEGRVLFVGMSRAKDELAMLEFPSKYPFYYRSFDDGRKRWQRWLLSMTHLELGCDGDVDEESIVRADLMGGPEIVAETQKYLAESESDLVGEPVTLLKKPIPGRTNRFFYEISLGDNGAGRCLGFLRPHVTLDILKVRSAGKYLPGKIYGLRIGAVTSSVSNKDLHVTVPSPWRDSKFWLSVTIHGIGQFK